MVKRQTKKFWESKTKIAAILIGIGPVLITIGGILGGSIDFASGMIQLTTETGIILGVFGLRDLNPLN